jgi:ADP-ribosylglycohydrolase
MVRPGRTKEQQLKNHMKKRERPSLPLLRLRLFFNNNGNSHGGTRGPGPASRGIGMAYSCPAAWRGVSCSTIMARSTGRTTGLRLTILALAAIAVALAAGASWAAPAPTETAAPNPTATAAPRPSAARSTLNATEFTDRVGAGWLGKTIGYTLGLPFKGKRDTNRATFYTQIKAGDAAACEGLDFPVLWLKAVEDRGRPEARQLADLWARHVLAEWKEYGALRRNLKAGLLPPLSGEFDNAEFKNSDGGLIRAEVWACLAPGCPVLAAQMAREDACLDHALGEGTWAEVFLASVQSAAFIEPDREKLVALGLGMIPETSAVAAAVRRAVEVHRAGQEWGLARDALVLATAETGWGQAPRATGFLVLAFLYGDGSFEKTVCLAANAGDDTDITAAAAGALMGILGGSQSIPARWSEPLSGTIKTPLLSGLTGAPENLKALTTRTVAAARKLLDAEGAAVAVAEGPTDLAAARGQLASAAQAARPLWTMPLYRTVITEPAMRVTLEYPGDPILPPEKPFTAHVTVENRTAASIALEIQLDRLPNGWRASSSPSKAPPLPAGATASLDLTFQAPEVEEGPHAMVLELLGGPTTVRVPLALFGRESATQEAVGPDDLALASAGAVAKADSESSKENSPASKVIDGLLASGKDFKNRWQSSPSAPSPHWVQVTLPKPEALGRVVLRFADPAAHPVNFSGLILDADGHWVEIFHREGYTGTRAFRTEIRAVTTQTFRLFITRSSDPKDSTAAQISEIELYPPAK